MTDIDRIKQENPLESFFHSRGFALVGVGRTRTSNRCPAKEHKKGHLCVTVDTEKNLWHCNDCELGGSFLDWLMVEQGKTLAEVLKPFEPAPMPQAPRGEIDTCYDYYDETGQFVYQVVRMKPKDFRQRRKGENGEWIWSMGTTRRVLYNLPQVLNPKNKWVWVVEGEKDAINLIKLGLCATTNVGGAKKWMASYAECLKGKDVVLCGDNDDAGRAHMKLVLESLTEKANSIRQVNIPGAHKDVSDFILTFASSEEAQNALGALAESAPVITGGMELPIQSMEELEAEYVEHLKLAATRVLDLGHWLPTLGRKCRKVVPGEVVTILAATGVGKCFGKGTPILMSNGTIKAVETIVDGDSVMGPDSKPKTVHGTTTGRSEMFLIQPRNGDSFVCNGEHILNLKRTNSWQENGSKSGGRWRGGETVNITVKEYLTKSKTFKHLWKLWHTGVEFAPAQQEIDPYILGIWLGDGHSDSPAFTTGDIEIKDAILAFAEERHLKSRIESGGGCETISLSAFTPQKKVPASCAVIGCARKVVARSLCGNHYNMEQYYDRIVPHAQNSFLADLKNIGVLRNKHIPTNYKIASSDQRMKLLAGLIDTDGYCPKRSVAVFTSTLQVLAEDVLYVARSLGFMCSIRKKRTALKSRNYIGTAYDVCICGDVHTIPTKLKRRRPGGTVQRKQCVSAFSVTSIGQGDYYGFMVGGNGLFLLGDFTVTHNTALLQNLARAARPIPTLLFELELPASLTFERFCALSEGVTCATVENDYAAGQRREWRASGSLGHIFTCSRSKLTPDLIETLINKAELKMAVRPGLVLIDYIQLIRGMGQKRYEVVSDAAESLKTIAKSTKTIIVLASQLKRKEEGDIEVTLTDAKESGAIENSAGLVLGVWRPDHETLHMRILKNTKGRSDKKDEHLVCNFDGQTMTITERCDSGLAKIDPEDVPRNYTD
jgi:5S rRNA maturation endonuclease (ribonuclease M5)